MREFRVELRASPDTPKEEIRRTLGPQTVIYHVHADSPELAAEIAIKAELQHLYRRIVKLFEPPTEIIK